MKNTSTSNSNAEEKASNFYNSIGWETSEGISEDARRWEDLREYAQEYVSKCRLRICEHIPNHGDFILDMASGPLQYKEYLEYSKNFQKRYCIDLSSKALEDAKKKIGDHGVFLQGSFFDIPLDKNFFDCAISLHTILHIDKDKQEEAVRKLVEVTKPGKPIVIVYGNPRTYVKAFKKLKKIRKKLKGLFKQHRKPDKSVKKCESALYGYHYPLSWWQRFSDIAEIKIMPWRSFDSITQKRLFPNNKLGKKMLTLLFLLEDKFPNFFVKHFQYPMIILTKK